MSLLTSLLCSPLISFGKKKELRPPLEYPFDVSKKSLLDITFEIDIYRHYIFALRFPYADPADMARIRDAVGDGGYKIFTKDSADTDHPLLVLSNSAEDAIKVDKGLKSGEYVSRPTKFDGQITIGLRLFTAEKNESIPVFDETLKTLGYFGHGFSRAGGGYFDRKITVSALRPGTYRLLVDAKEDIKRFENIQTKFLITFHPNEAPLNK